MSTRTRVRRSAGAWEATCHECEWLFWAHQMRDVMAAARNHQCRPILGPKPLPPGTTIEGVGAQMQAYVELPAVSHHRIEVWL